MLLLVCPEHSSTAAMSLAVIEASAAFVQMFKGDHAANHLLSMLQFCSVQLGFKLEGERGVCSAGNVFL